jgi:DNA repair protein REV1
MGYADELQAVSVDEALIDVTSAVGAREAVPQEAIEDGNGLKSTVEMQKTRDAAVEIAEKIRDDVRKLTDGCEGEPENHCFRPELNWTVSIGISHNILLAKLATRRAKPAGVFHLQTPDVPPFLAALDVEDFPSVGYSIKSKIEENFGTTTCGDLLEHSKGAFQKVLGPKTGEMVYGYLRGVDEKKLEPHKERKSISAEMNVIVVLRRLKDSTADEGSTVSDSKVNIKRTTASRT